MAGVFATTTLVLKTIARAKAHEIATRRQSLPESAFAEDRWLRLSLACLKAAGVVYLIFFGGIYLWVYGFSLERANVMAGIRAMGQEAESTGFSLQVGGSSVGVGKSAVPTAAPEVKAMAAPVNTLALAGSTAVILMVLWALHGGLWFLPTEGVFDRLPLAGFNREEVASQMERAVQRRGQALRALHLRIQNLDAEGRSSAVGPLLQPVARLLNETIGYTVVEPVSPASEASASTMTAPSAPAGQTPAPAAGAAASPATAGPEHTGNDALSALFQS